jgi:hypothetical protein
MKSRPTAPQVQKAKIKYELAKEAMKVVDTLTSSRQIAEKQADATESERELVRVLMTADATLAKLHADLVAARLTNAVRIAVLEGTLRQIEACNIRAPRDGLVVYANASRAETGRKGKSILELLIYEGAIVQERQPRWFRFWFGGRPLTSRDVPFPSCSLSTRPLDIPRPPFFRHRPRVATNCRAKFPVRRERNSISGVSSVEKTDRER